MNENENVLLKSEEDILMKVVLLMPSDARLNFNILKFIISNRKNLTEDV